MKVVRGVTRTVLVGPKRVYKLPGGLGFSYHALPGNLIRGWLANRSEWKQRRRPDVAAPAATIAHVVLVMPRADIAYVDQAMAPTGIWDRYTGDEGKPSSWGWFPAWGWRLIDYDRAWDADCTGGRGIIGGLYYGHQERLARKWSALPSADA